MEEAEGCPMRILVDTRWIAPHGIGRFAAEVLNRLPDFEPLPPGPAKLSLRDPFWLSHIISRLRPQVYFSPGFNPPLRSSVPFIFTIHDLIHLDIPEECSAIKRLYYRWIVRPAAGRAFRVLTVSDYSRRRIMEWADVPEDRVVVVGNGVLSGFELEGSRHTRDKPYLLFVGNAKPHKNLRRLLEAYARSGRSGDVGLVLCAPQEPATLRWVSELGLQGKVHVTGTLSDKELQAHYRGALALLFPSLSEGFGLPALEAMACGTPVLSSAITSLPEVVGDAAWIVDPCQIDSITAGIQRLVDEGDLREELIRRGLARARLFSWEKTAEIVRRVIREAIT